MLLLKWIWIGNGQGGEVTPAVVFWTLRVLMFLLSFVLEDWAFHELVDKPRHRSLVILLVASSYVTWTFQAHTFSNSLETILVAWSLVLIQRIVDDKVCTFWSLVCMEAATNRYTAADISLRIYTVGLPGCLWVL